MGGVVCKERMKEIECIGDHRMRILKLFGYEKVRCI